MDRKRGRLTRSVPAQAKATTPRASRAEERRWELCTMLQYRSTAMQHRLSDAITTDTAAHPVSPATPLLPNEDRNPG